MQLRHYYYRYWWNKETTDIEFLFIIFVALLLIVGVFGYFILQAIVEHIQSTLYWRKVEKENKRVKQPPSDITQSETISGPTLVKVSKEVTAVQDLMQQELLKRRSKNKKIK